MILLNLTAGKWVSQAIAVVAGLGITDLLKDGAKSAADIARAVNASEDGVSWSPRRMQPAWLGSGKPGREASSGCPVTTCCSTRNPK